MKKLPKNYKPSEKEKFMNPKMREYFRLQLINWKKDLLKESSNTLNNLQKEENVTRKLITKIDTAIKRIENETYGYCEETGDHISIKRLVARPIATLSLESQEAHERKEKNKTKR